MSKCLSQNLKIMATLHFSVLKSRQTTKKTYVIYLAITHKRDVRYISTDYEIDDLFQFDNGKVVCRKDAKVMNQRLDYVLSEYQDKLNDILDQHIYNCSQIKEILEGHRKLEQLITIKDCMDLRIQSLRKEGRNSYADMNVYTLKNIISSLGNITIQSITPASIDKFNKWMSGFSNATRQMGLSHFKACLNELIRAGSVKYEVHPFSLVKMPKSQPRQMDLTIDEFVRIRDFKTQHKELSLGRDLLLFSFYLGGINLVDLITMDFSGDSVIYVRKKTSSKKEGEKRVTFTIPEAVKPLIKKYKSRNGRLDFGYKFTYSNFQRYLNRCLKKLRKCLDIESNLCYYSGRKTFSQFAFDLGIRTEIVEYCLGQSMKENRPIYNYVRVMKRQADAAIKKVIEYTENPEDFELSIIAC